MYTLVVSKPWAEEAMVRVFKANKPEYCVTLPERDVGSTLFDLVRQYSSEGVKVTVTVERRKARRT